MIINGIYYSKGVFYTKKSLNNSVYDEEEWITYVDNQLMIKKNSILSDSDFNGVINEFGARVVNKPLFSDIYRIEFADKKTYKELNRLANDLINNSGIEAVSVIVIVDKNAIDRVKLSRQDFFDKTKSGKFMSVILDEDFCDLENITRSKLYSLLEDSEQTLYDGNVKFANNIENGSYSGKMEKDEVKRIARTIAERNSYSCPIIYDEIIDEPNRYTYTYYLYEKVDDTCETWCAEMVFLVKKHLYFNKLTNKIQSDSQVIGNQYINVESEFCIGVYGNGYEGIADSFLGRILY